MSNKIIRRSLLLTLIFCLCIGLTACDKLNGVLGGKADEGVALPSMEQEPRAEALSKDAQGLTESDHQYLAYAKDKAERFNTAFSEFGTKMDSYVDKIFTASLVIKDSKEYTETRDALYKACAQIERVRPDALPEEIKNLYEHLYYVANQARAMLTQVFQRNGTNLPKAYDDCKAVIDPELSKINAFIGTAESTGVDAAQNELDALDYDAILAAHPENRNTGNVSDYGIKWGASRFEVMGVEGLLPDAYSKEELGYACDLYNYKATRYYHFNEYDQLDSYRYDVDGSTFDYTHTSEDPVYNDVYDLAPLVMYWFVLDTPALPQTPTSDANGVYTVSFDLAAETVVIAGDSTAPNDPIRITVTAKRLEG